MMPFIYLFSMALYLKLVKFTPYVNVNMGATLACVYQFYSDCFSKESVLALERICVEQWLYSQITTRQWKIMEVNLSGGGGGWGG